MHTNRRGTILPGAVLLLPAAALLAVLAAPPPAARGAEAPDLKAFLEELYISPLEAAARYDEWVARMIELASGPLPHPEATILFERIGAAAGKCRDPRPARDFFESFAGKDLPNGLIALSAANARRRALLERGRYEEAAAQNAFGAYARTVLASGPFGFYTGSLHDVSFPPESRIDLGGRYEGYAGPVGWTLVSREDSTPGIAPFDVLYPRAGCCYALYQFRVPAGTPALLAFSYGGSAKVWFDGGEILDVNRNKERLPRSFLVPVRAAAGWNRVLIKLSSGRFPFFLVVTDRSGRPIEGFEECREAVLHPAPTAPPEVVKPFDPATVGAAAFLEEYVKEHPKSVAARLALADALDKRALESRAVGEGRTAVDLDPRCAHAAFFLGTLYRNASYLPRNFRDNRAREMFAKALAIDPGFLPARLALARNDAKNDRKEKAIRSLRSILAENPGYYRARMVLAGIFESLEWKAEFEECLEKARAVAPRRTAPLEKRADFLESFGRDDLAAKIRERALDLDRSRRDLMEEEADYAWERGEYEKALGLLDRILSMGNDDGVLRKEAFIARAAGDKDRARALLKGICDEHPGNPGPLLDLADFLLEEGEEDEARRLYGEALAAAPDLHDTRILLAELGVEEARDPLFESYEVRGGDFMKDLPGKKEFPKASSILALDHQITRVYPDGSTKMRIHQIVKILDKNAVEEYGSLRLPGRIEMVRTITPGGKILEPVDAGEPGAFTMPGVEEGCLVETCFTVRESDSYGKPLDLGRFFFQDKDGKQPFLFSRSVVILPAALKIREEVEVPEMFTREVERRGGDIVRVYTARNTPVAELENLMPPDEEVFPNVNLVQYRDWTQVAQILANIHEPRVVVTREIEEKAAELTAGLSGTGAIARKLYAFVNDLVKSDEGGSEAIDVLLERCGDRGNLFMALLDAAGVRYDYLRCGIASGYRARPADFGRLDIDLFPRGLVRIPAGDGGRSLLVSTDSRMRAFGEIPPYLFGAPAVRVTGRPQRIETIPGGDPDAFREIDIDLHVRLDGDDAEIEGTLVFPGFGRTRIQEQMMKMDTAKRRQAFEYSLMRSIYPGARVERLKITGIDERGARPTFTFTLRARNFVQPEGDSKACRLLPRPPELTRAFIRKPERKYPMVRRGRSSYRYAMTVDLGDAYRLERLPESLVVRRFFLNYSLLTGRTEKGYEMEQVLELLPGDVEPGEYDDLIAAMRAVDERAMEPVVLEPCKEKEP